MNAAPIPKTTGLPHGVADYEDFRRVARWKLPGFAFDYLDGGIGLEKAIGRNRVSLDDILFLPLANGDPRRPDMSVTLFGETHRYPVAVAPVGFPGLFCPGAETALALASKNLDLPFALSMVASAGLEEVARIVGKRLWFQLYPPEPDEVRHDLMARAERAGVQTLMITVDAPAAQRRERILRSGMRRAHRRSCFMLAALTHPVWGWRMFLGPRPQILTLEPYVGSRAVPAGQQYVEKHCVRPLGPEDIARFKEEWHGNLIVKGVLHPDTASRMMAAGADGLVVSNHGGRQLDAAPAPAAVLPRIRDAVGDDVVVIADGGASSALDVLRFLRLGADMVLMGKYPYMAVAALGCDAAGPALNLVAQQMSQIMIQLGVRSIAELRSLDTE